MNKNNRPQGMSQLDYLWLNYGGYQIGSTPSSVPQKNVILNELAVTSLIKNATNGGIMSLQYIDHPTDESLTRLVGKSIDGDIVTFVDMPKEVHVQSFVGREVNSQDLANGCSYPLKTKVLSIVLSNGKEYLVSLNSLGLVLQGAETKTAVSEIIDGKVYNHVKVDKVSLSVVELKETSYGLSANLNISPDKTGVNLVKADNGLQAKIPFGNTGKFIKFERMSLNTYMALAYKEDDTIYFISDKPYIFVGEQRYGMEDLAGETVSRLDYNEDTMTLYYTVSDGNERSITLGPASDSKNGMLSKSDYATLQGLKRALDGIISVKDYVNLQIEELGATLTYGQEIVNGKRPLYLNNSKGETLSTVWLKEEVYLSSSINRKATKDDVIAAQKAGVTLEEGEQIIILSLTNGDKHYLKLMDIVVTQSFTNSNTIKFNNNSADVILANNKILYITEEGLSAGIQVIKDGNFIKLYGYDTSQAIGKFMAPTKELQSTLFIPSITQEDITMYPPSMVNWKPEQTVNLGEDYYLLFYKDYNDTDQIYYISIPKARVGISNIEGNLLKADDNGDLYVLFEWIEQN